MSVDSELHDIENQLFVFETNFLFPKMRSIYFRSALQPYLFQISADHDIRLNRALNNVDIYLNSVRNMHIVVLISLLYTLEGDQQVRKNTLLPVFVSILNQNRDI